MSLQTLNKSFHLSLSFIQSGEVGVNSADEVDVCPLHVAAANGHVALVSLLLGHGANPDQVKKNYKEG